MASVSPLLLRLPIYSGAPSIPSLTRRQFSRFSFSSQENGTGAVQGEEKGEPKADDDEEDAAAARAAEELKAAMAMRKAKREEENEAGGLIGGAGEEIREIESPAFGMVVGTTGVVVTVIAGSSVALLTVNAVLAALSDRVFTKSIQTLPWLQAVWFQGSGPRPFGHAIGSIQTMRRSWSSGCVCQW